MREYNAIAMDLDDTLLTSDLQISNETKKALLKCQEDGIIVILASGRPIYAIEKYAKELELEKYGGYIVGFNGAAVKDCHTGQLIMQKNLPAITSSGFGFKLVHSHFTTRCRKISITAIRRILTIS